MTLIKELFVIAGAVVAYMWTILYVGVHVVGSLG